MIRKIIFLILFILVFCFSIAFAAFNTEAVTINVYFTQWQLPLSVLTIVVLLIGLLAGASLIWISSLRMRYENRQLHHKLNVAEQELNSLRILPLKDQH